MFDFFHGKAQKRRRMLLEQFGLTPAYEERERGKERLEEIGIYHRELEARCGASGIDDITWNDLEMDEIFFRINHTRSYIGEQVLYHWLHAADPRKKQSGEEAVHRDQDGLSEHSADEASKEELLLEKQIAFYTEHADKRVQIEEKLCRIGKREEDYHMPAFLMHAELWNIGKGYFLHILQALLMIFLIGSIWTEQLLCVAGLCAVAFVNLAVYLWVKQKYEIFLYSLGSLKQLLEFCQMLIKEDYREALHIPEEIVRITQALKGLSKSILGIQERKRAAWSGDMMYLAQDYIFGITLLDVSAFNHIMKLVDSRQEEILQLYEFAGSVDAGISIASFRASLPFYCLPQIWERHQICAEHLIHPLLEHSVANDLTMEHRALITGSNASGKSTFLKALAVNAILAKTIHTCTAKRFSMSDIQIITSMSLRDDLQHGESYYLREAKRIREMLKQDRPSLMIIDEILKGTNTTERVAASYAILDYFTETPHFMIVATHDLDLVRDMRGKYDCYYFESRVTEQDIVFEYRIKKGISGGSNAIALLALLGYPESIVAAADQRARLV